MSYIGPTLPPHLQKAYHSENSDSDEGDFYGPALPVHLKSQNQVSNKLVQSNMSNEARCPVNHEVDSSSDDKVIGPLPADCMSAEQSSSIEIEQRALKMKKKLLYGDNDEANKEPKREEWMIELPELKRKNFGLGPRSFNRSDKPEVVGRDQWTSTPTSKASTSKEKDEVLEAEMKKQYLEQKRNKKLEKIVAVHDKTKRSESLLKIHQKEMKKKKDNSSSSKERKPFDRDEDLKLNKIDDSKRKSLIKKSRELNSKFKIGNQKYL